MAQLASVFLLLIATTVNAHPPLQLLPSTNHLVTQEPKSYHPSTVLDSEGQLGGFWIPSRYHVALTINLDQPFPGNTNFTARGNVEINFRVTDSEPVRDIVIHANRDHYLEDPSFKLMEAGTEIGLQPPDFVNDYDSLFHFLTLRLENTSGTLEPNKDYKLVVQSIAKISLDTTNGLYRSYYTDSDGNNKLIATTQMESYHLRQVFPCFDEPDLKAVFEVELTHEAKYTALANGMGQDPVEIPGTNWATTRFSATEKMSTYLFAITIAEFTAATAAAELFSKPVKTWGDPALIAKDGGQYTADLTAKLLKYFDDYFQTTYPMEKMDSAAITHKGGAMENWGLILYRTDLLIYLAGETLETSKNSIASVVSHEVAHQNFGNLVTCKWWSDIWLNEGFATYVSYLGIDAVAPEFRHGEWQINDAMQPALAYDSGPNTHPLQNDAKTPEEIDRYFSSITYDKGSSINRMIEGFLTPTTFHNALINYLADKKNTGAVQDDLFVHLQTEAVADERVLPEDATIKDILDTWTTKSGHPLVRVSVKNETSVFISQERYFSTPDVSNELWYVPITIITKTNNTLDDFTPQLWLTTNDTITTVDHDVSTWIMINANAHGFYRVLYDTTLTRHIRSQLMTNPATIYPLSRSQLLDDYFNLAFKGYVNIQTALELTTYLEKEDHFTVWEVVFNQFRNVHKFLEDPTSTDIFRKYLLPKLEPHLKNIGIAQNSSVVGAQEILRMKLMDWACSLGSHDCVMHAHELHAEWEDKNTIPVHVDIQGPVFCAIVGTGGQTGFDFLLGRYKEAVDSSALKTRLLNGLACAGGEILEGLLNSTLAAASDILPIHRLPLIQRIGMNTEGRRMVLKFLSANLESIITTIGGEERGVISTILSGLSSQLSTQEALDETLEFLSDNRERLDGLNFDASIANIRSNINWANLWVKPIVEWMEKNPHPPKEVSGGSRIGSGAGFFATMTLLVGVFMARV